MGQLRDDVLRSTFSKTERERLWMGVKAIVEQNSNVRAGNREGERTGEWSRVWEWIGPLNLGKAVEVEGSGGRRSVGLFREAGEAIDTNNGIDGDGETKTGRQLLESRKWDEGRPIY